MVAFYGGKGNNTLVGRQADFSGSAGSDTFLLVAGEGTDTILDLAASIDLLGLAGGLFFSQLEIV